MESNEQNKINKQNRIKDIETWNRLTAVRGEGEGGTGWKMKGLAKEHICMTHGHGQPCGDCLREWEGGLGGGGQRGGNWDNCNGINSKVFF